MELLSHFFPDPPPEGELPPFHVNRIYNNVMRLLSYVRRALVYAAARCCCSSHGVRVLAVADLACAGCDLGHPCCAQVGDSLVVACLLHCTPGALGGIALAPRRTDGCIVGCIVCVCACVRACVAVI